MGGNQSKCNDCQKCQSHSKNEIVQVYYDNNSTCKSIRFYKSDGITNCYEDKDMIPLFDSDETTQDCYTHRETVPQTGEQKQLEIKCKCICTKTITCTCICNIGTTQDVVQKSAAILASCVSSIAGIVICFMSEGILPLVIIGQILLNVGLESLEINIIFTKMKKLLRGKEYGKNIVKSVVSGTAYALATAPGGIFKIVIKIVTFIGNILLKVRTYFTKKN